MKFLLCSVLNHDFLMLNDNIIAMPLYSTHSGEDVGYIKICNRCKLLIFEPSIIKQKHKLELI